MNGTGGNKVSDFHDGFSSPARPPALVAQPDLQPTSVPTVAELLDVGEPPAEDEPDTEPDTEPEAEAAVESEPVEPDTDAPDPAPLTAEGDPAAFDELVADATVADLTAAIEAGTLDLAAVVASEQRGKQRKGILSLAPDTDPEAS